MTTGSMRYRCSQIALDLFFCGIACSSVLSAHQQSQSSSQTEPPPLFRSEHNEVEVVVIVRDSKGRPVSNLKQSDFEIRDDGKLQTINSFAIQGGGTQQDLTAPTPTTPTTVSQTAMPQAVQLRFVALFFDDVHTQAGDFGRVQKAAEQFVQEGLQPNDRVTIFKTSGNGEVTFTNDKPKLLATIDALRAHPFENTSTIRQCPRLTSYEAYLIVNQLDPDVLNMVAQRAQNCTCPPPADGCPPLDEFKRMAQGYAQEIWQTQKNSYQNLLAGLDLTVRVLGTMPGRRMLVLSSSGFLSGDLDPDVNRVIDNALRGAVVINALSAKGLYAESPGGNLGEQRLEGTFSVGNGEVSRYEARQFGTQMQAEDAAMIDFAESTGGRFFNNNNNFLQGLDQLMTSETAYLMAFSPHPLKQDGRFHKLKIDVKLPRSFRVYARKGYFALTEKEIRAARSTSGSELPVSISNADARATTETKTGVVAVPTPEKTAAPAEVRRVETPAKPIAEATGGLNTHPTLESAPTTIASNNVSSSPAGEPATTDVAARRGSEVAFLNSASREVEHYIQAFGDLTADETRSMEVFDEDGLSSRTRTMRSALVVYRLRTEPASVIEYRDVLSVDGRQVKDHILRARKVWEGLAQARSPEDEIKRITTDTERYDIGLEETGVTLFEGLPLRALCAGDFTFRELRRETMDGRQVRVFAYNQIHPCSVGKYHLGLPDPFATYPLVQAGELALDAETGQTIQEERNVYAGNLNKKPPRVAHIVLAYGEGSFGIRVPKMIVMETFRPIKNPNMVTTGNFRLYARMVQTYGPFSRFEVSTAEKDEAAKR